MPHRRMFANCSHPHHRKTIAKPLARWHQPMLVLSSASFALPCAILLGRSKSRSPDNRILSHRYRTGRKSSSRANPGFLKHREGQDGKMRQARRTSLMEALRRDPSRKGPNLLSAEGSFQHQSDILSYEGILNMLPHSFCYTPPATEDSLTNLTTLLTMRTPDYPVVLIWILYLKLAPHMLIEAQPTHKPDRDIQLRKAASFSTKYRSYNQLNIPNWFPSGCKNAPHCAFTVLSNNSRFLFVNGCLQAFRS